MRLAAKIIIWFAVLPFIANAAPADAIRRIDFKNFSYPFPDPNFGKSLGKMIKVRRGKFDERHIKTDVGFGYFRVAEVLFGDLTGDGRDEAVVTAIYGSNSGTYYLTNIYIYTLMNNRSKLLGVITQNSAEKIYESYYRKDEDENRGYYSLFEAIEGGRRISAGKLVVQHYADGGHCCPEKTATFEYKWSGKRMELVRLLKREPSRRDEKMKAYYNRN
jgi:hypothetical protein